MKKRPLSITIMGWIFIALGGILLGARLLSLVGAAASRPNAGLKAEPPRDIVLALVSNLLAAIGGAFLLYGFNWARWLVVVWMGFHVALSVLHSPFELIVHSLFFSVVLYVLFRPRASVYFRGTKAQPPLGDSEER